MSTTELPRYAARSAAHESAATTTSAVSLLRLALAPLASLKLTVTLLTLSLFLVLAGTVAQIDHDVWYVVHNYFRTWWTWIHVGIFLPRAWELPDWAGFPFVGGKAIGVALAVNLLAAHAVRFKVAAKGRRLALGLAVIVAGMAATYAVIASGANIAVESQLSPAFINGLWHALRAAVGAGALALGYVLALSWRQSRNSAAVWLWWIGAVGAVLLAALAAYLFTHPEATLDASGLRILWQMAKASAAASVLAVGSWAVFGKRGGVVLLHGGIALLMFGELYTSQYVRESQMSITEGETVAFAEDMREVELAVTDLSSQDVDRTTLVPEAQLLAALEERRPISHPDLPFEVQVVTFMKNASTRWLQPGEAPLANAGVGQLKTADARGSAKGVDVEQAFDAPAAVLRLAADGAPKNGKYLMSPTMLAETVTHDGKTYQATLRYKRIPKDYSVTLIDFKHDQYEGTTKAKNFESKVRLEDPEQKIDVTVHISMNNPLRYAGDTLYQHKFDPRTEKTTFLQVMTNAGWMIPWASCMIVLFGMGFHFILSLTRFVSRLDNEALVMPGVRRWKSAPGSWTERWSRIEYWLPALVVLAFAGDALRRASPPRESATEMKIHEFGELPVVYGGRTQPLDSLARNTLRLISNRATYEDSRYDDRQPAVRWLLDVVSRSEAFRKHKVVRIVNLEVLQTLGLEQRPGNWRYSISELLEHGEELQRQLKLAAEVPKEKRNHMQSKFVELDEQIRRIMVLIDVFSAPDIDPELVTKALASAEVDRQTVASLTTSLLAADERIEFLNQFAPRPIPPSDPGAEWRTIMEAQRDSIVGRLTNRAEGADDEATRVWLTILAAYRAGDAQKFNSAVAELKGIVAERAVAERQFERERTSNRKTSERLDPERLAFESYFNYFDPFMIAMVMYVAAFLLSAAAWLGWFEGFNRAANWLLWLTFALHTFGLVCRIYVSGRPPITNLYATAVFIGWAGVLFGLIFEVIYKMGVGNLVASILGFPTMIIAYQLSFDNNADTIEVLQAVLDTNFWLTTHVICINLGYATTLLAGVIGAVSLLMGYVGRLFGPNDLRQLNRMTYGTLCFAIFFSFIGTVLGGLWADDSWGRFWGWDPKENGALMIVIWNAIVLHARFGKMVGQRGLAALVVLGNIVVAWSWFGVNQMGVGLHAYGFIEGRSLLVALFMISQLVIVAVTYLAPLLTGGSSDAEFAAASAP